MSLALAQRVAAVGIDWTLAPVADVNSAPDNPVIGVRSFGAAPELVARHVAAAVTGIQQAGVAACAKHFPGHGDTTVDSHVGLPTAGPDLAGALEPFRAAVAAGVLTVMTGHLLVSGYGDLPATLNPALVDGLLRRELGFDGVVVSDALEMGAIAGTVGVGEGAVLAQLAGVDALCLGGDAAGEPIADAARNALVAAVRSGRLPAERLAAAAGRVRALGRRPRTVPAVATQLEKAGLAVARRALHCAGRVRLAAGPPVVVRLDPAPTIAVGRTAWGLDGLLPGATELVVGPDDALPAVPAGRGLVVVARDAARVGWGRPRGRRAARRAAGRGGRGDGPARAGSTGGRVDRHRRGLGRLGPRRRRGSARDRAVSRPPTGAEQRPGGCSVPGARSPGSGR